MTTIEIIIFIIFALLTNSILGNMKIFTTKPNKCALKIEINDDSTL